MSVDLLLNISNGTCGHCGRPETACGARYALRLRSQQRASLRRSDAHSAWCLPCLYYHGQAVMEEAADLMRAEVSA